MSFMMEVLYEQGKKKGRKFIKESLCKLREPKT
jgi:hypothetical protein